MQFLKMKMLVMICYGENYLLIDPETVTSQNYYLKLYKEPFIYCLKGLRY